MPVVELHLIRGYSDDARQRICQSLTDAIRMVVPAPVDAVTVMIHEVDDAGYMRGRTARKPAPALPDAAGVVTDYLAAMEARDLDRARAFLDEAFVMQFPGTAPMRTLEELVAWSRPRYAFVRKSFDGIDQAKGEGDLTVVFCRGTLSGEWHDGSACEGIRFVDRFELRDGKIVRQDVWNDLAEEMSGS